MGPGTLRSRRSEGRDTRPAPGPCLRRGTCPLQPWETFQSEEGNLSTSSEGLRAAKESPPRHTRKALPDVIGLHGDST